MDTIKDKLLNLLHRPEILLWLGGLMVILAVVGVVGLLLRPAAAPTTLTGTPTASTLQYTPRVATFTPVPPTATQVAPTEGHATATPIPLPTAAMTVTHTIIEGDTLSGIALKYNVPVEVIKTANDMTEDAVYLGAVLIIPAPTMLPTATPPSPDAGIVHVVAENETLGAIALHYAVTTAALLAANNLESPDLIYVGQTLLIPSDAGDAPTTPLPTIR